MNLEALGGRKFLLTLLVLATATAVELCTQRGITESYGLLLAGIVGIYGASNVAITRGAMTANSAAGVSEGTATAEPNIELIALDAKIDDLKATVDATAATAAQTAQLLMTVAGRKG